MATPKPDLWAQLPPHKLRSLAQAWLEEDCPFSEAAAAAVGRSPLRAQLLAKSPGVLAGGPFAQAVWEEVGCSVRWAAAEGSRLPAGRTLVAAVEGPAAALLLAERAALNALGRCSGVATVAAQAVEVAKGLGWPGKVAGTRKTTPGFRLAEKYALAVGGAEPHRPGLGALVLLKDNHLAAARAPLEEVLGVARQAGGFTQRLGVECSNLEDAVRAAKAGVDIVLLDNFTPEELHRAAEAVKAWSPGVQVEASGGIVPETLPQFLSPKVDVVSMGFLTHSAPNVDFALRVLKPDQEEP